MLADDGQRLEAMLREGPAPSAIELLLPDLNGILRGKRIAPSAFAALSAGALPFPVTGCLVDSRGALIDTLPHGLHDGDPDQRCVPVAGSLARVPWSASPLAQCLVALQAPDGAPHFADSRHVAQRAVTALAGLGLTAVVAIELEFYLLADDAARPPVAWQGRVPGTQRAAGGPRVYSVEDLHALDPLFADIQAACTVQGIPAGDIISEYGSGQFEVNLGHVADAVQACDHAALLRRLVRGVAARHGLAATFMAKPFAALDGSGMHVHVSLRDARGRNVFSPPAGGGGGLATPLRHAVGGLLAALPGSRAVFCPNANSYRRLQPGHFAPVAADWGVNHRGVAVRLPLADGDNARFEHRYAGADANPWLVVAAILAAVHHGIAERIEPPPMAGTRGATGAAPGAALRWESALDDFTAGQILPARLGEDFCAVYAAARRFEAETRHAEVPAEDYDWYLPCI